MLEAIILYAKFLSAYNEKKNLWGKLFSYLMEILWLRHAELIVFRQHLYVVPVDTSLSEYIREASEKTAGGWICLKTWMLSCSVLP